MMMGNKYFYQVVRRGARTMRRAMSQASLMATATKRATSSTAGVASRKSAKLMAVKKTIPMTLQATLPKPSMAMATSGHTRMTTTTS